MNKSAYEMIVPPRYHLIAAQDQDSWNEAEKGLSEYGGLIDLAKVNSLADRIGLDEIIRRQGQWGQLTMVDYKYNDIEDTMRRRTREATLAGGSVITLHASASEAGLLAAVKGVDEALELNPNLRRPMLVGVTVLTSFDDATSESIFGIGRLKKVKQFSHMAVDSGLDGIVCSVREAEQTRGDPYTESLVQFLAAVRPSYAIEPDEQATAETPRMAREVGADFMLVGRPLIRAREFGLRDGLLAAAIIHHEYDEGAI